MESVSATNSSVGPISRRIIIPTIVDPIGQHGAGLPHSTQEGKPGDPKHDQHTVHQAHVPPRLMASVSPYATMLPRARPATPWLPPWLQARPAYAGIPGKRGVRNRRSPRVWVCRSSDHGWTCSSGRCRGNVLSSSRHGIRGCGPCWLPGLGRTPRRSATGDGTGDQGRSGRPRARWAKHSWHHKARGGRRTKRGQPAKEAPGIEDRARGGPGRRDPGAAQDKNDARLTVWMDKTGHDAANAVTLADPQAIAPA
jgi:hypothetical protein